MEGDVGCVGSTCCIKHDLRKKIDFFKFSVLKCNRTKFVFDDIKNKADRIFHTGESLYIQMTDQMMFHNFIDVSFS